MERKRVNREQQDELVNTINAKQAKCAALKDEASKLWDEIYDARAHFLALEVEEADYLDPMLHVAQNPSVLMDELESRHASTEEEVDGE